MQPMDKDPILAVAVHAARRAASVLVDVARDLKRRPAHAKTKDHTDIVTNGDTEAENAMIATLRAAYPEHAIVGREAGEIVSQIAGGNRVGKNTPRWIVDPLDGAGQFPARLPVLRRIDRAHHRATRSPMPSSSTPSTTISSPRSRGRARN
jgi:myo-inositol-1(or 4)-monophosphatase